MRHRREPSSQHATERRSPTQVPLAKQKKKHLKDFQTATPALCCLEMADTAAVVLPVVQGKAGIGEVEKMRQMPTAVFYIVVSWFPCIATTM